jgi:hypothetical protein
MPGTWPESAAVSPGDWLGDRSEEEVVWLAGGAAARGLDPDGSYVFPGSPWQVWLDARAAGESLEALAILGHHLFLYRCPDYGEWMTEQMTLAEMISGAMPEAIVRISRDTTFAESIEDLAADDLLLWDQASQTATPGPRLLPVLIAEDEEDMRRSGRS